MGKNIIEELEEMKTNLLSSVNKEGKYVTQIIHFKDGVKRTFSGILPDTLKQGQYTKMSTVDGRMLMVNDDNVLCIEVFAEGEE